MTWIRNPLWDGVWVLSGLPLGLILICLSGIVPVALVTFWITVLLQQSHNLAPVVMAWAHDGFRWHMMEHKMKFIAVPGAILLGSVLAGYLSEFLYPGFFPFRGTKIDVFGPEGWQSPLGLMLALYFVWNTYHFAKQNFGVLSIYRTKCGSGRRTADLVFALTVSATVTIIGIAAMFRLVDKPLIGVCVCGALAGVLVMLSLESKMTPRILFIVTDISRLALMFWSGLWGFTISGMNHWLVAIGLSGHVYANHKGRSALAFSVVLIVLGTAIFGAMFVLFPAVAGIHATRGPSPLPWWVRATMPAVSLRIGLGFVHFLYDRWLWKLSDPLVQAMIGKDLFRGAHRVPA